MADEFGSLDVKMVFDSQKTRIDRPNPDQKKHRHENKKEEEPPRSAKQYFHTITKAVERSNTILLEKNLPYRFCVYLEGDEVFIDLVRLDKNGAILDTVKKNITHEDFSRWIEDVSQIEGIFFDRSV